MFVKILVSLKIAVCVIVATNFLTFLTVFVTNHIVLSVFLFTNEEEMLTIAVIFCHVFSAMIYFLPSYERK